MSFNSGFCSSWVISRVFPCERTGVPRVTTENANIAADTFFIFCSCFVKGVDKTSGLVRPWKKKQAKRPLLLAPAGPNSAGEGSIGGPWKLYRTEHPGEIPGGAKDSVPAALSATLFAGVRTVQSGTDAALRIAIAWSN